MLTALAMIRKQNGDKSNRGAIGPNAFLLDRPLIFSLRCSAEKTEDGEIAAQQSHRVPEPASLFMYACMSQ